MSEEQVRGDYAGMKSYSQANLAQHKANCAPGNASFGVQVIKVIHDKLRRRRKVSLIELVGNVPAQGSELATLLKKRVFFAPCTDYWQGWKARLIVIGSLLCACKREREEPNCP